MEHTLEIAIQNLRLSNQKDKQSLLQIEDGLKQYKSAAIEKLTSDKAKKAFWINTYNAFASYLIAKHKVRNISHKPWILFLPKLNIGKYYFSLDDIYHGILRRNRRPFYSLWRQFHPFDQRRKFLLSEADYRIHFAVSCGALSCPTISEYSFKDVDTELDIMEYNYSHNNFKIDHQLKKLEVSAMYDWYQKDFVKVYLNSDEYRKFKVKVTRFNWKVS